MPCHFVVPPVLVSLTNSFSSFHLSEVLQDEDLTLLMDSRASSQLIPIYNVNIVFFLPLILLTSQLLVESELSAYIFMTINYKWPTQFTTFLHRFLFCLVFYIPITSLPLNSIKFSLIWSNISACLSFCFHLTP